MWLHVHYLLADLSHSLGRGKNPAPLCGMEALFGSGAIRDFVPWKWRESLEDAAEFVANKRRTKVWLHYVNLPPSPAVMQQ